MPGVDIPEIVWSTMPDPNGTPHIVPTIAGALMAGHTLDRKCPCVPRLERGVQFSILVHYVIH